MLCTFLVLSICLSFLSLKVISVFNGFQIETVREGDVTFTNTLFFGHLDWKSGNLGKQL